MSEYDYATVWRSAISAERVKRVIEAEHFRVDRELAAIMYDFRKEIIR